MNKDVRSQVLCTMHTILHKTLHTESGNGILMQARGICMHHNLVSSQCEQMHLPLLISQRKSQGINTACTKCTTMQQNCKKLQKLCREPQKTATAKKPLTVYWRHVLLCTQYTVQTFYTTIYRVIMLITTSSIVQ